MWCARFTEDQLQTLKELVRAQGELGPELEGALEALELARWDDLPEAELPWDSVSERASVQGISEADVIWDLAGRRKEDAVPKKLPVKHSSRRTANGRRKSTT